MTETLKRLVREVAQFSDETLIITLSILVLVLVILVVYWHYNKKKFHQLSHQIPASVLKTYLDSIIQNSTSLKSSLFRGGGLEIGEGIPSVVPVGDLPAGNISVGDSSEELNQKNAEIASLTARISEKDRQLGELEEKLRDAQASALSGGGDSSEEVAILKAEIEKLRAELEAAKNAAPAPAAGGGDEAMAQQLADVTKERDELKERLMEYEIIEEDLANLKRLQQENDQLKKTIAELQAGGEAPAPAAEPEPAPEPEPAAEPEPAPEEPAAEIPESAPEGEDLEAAMAAAINEPAAEAEAPAEDDGVPANEGEQKSAEELLSEFEKMLG